MKVQVMMVMLHRVIDRVQVDEVSTGVRLVHDFGLVV